MGRELRRKEAKKKGTSLKIKEEVKKKEPSELEKLLKTLGIIIGVIVIIYFLIAIVITKEIDLFRKDTVEQKTATTNQILAKNIFRQTEQSYYVYCYDFEEEEKDSSITSLVTSKLNSDKVYKVNIKDALNSNYIGEVTNKNISNVDELKINTTTLLKIEEDTITLFLEGNEIKEYLNNK